MLHTLTEEYLWCDKDINIDWGIDFEPVIIRKRPETTILKE